MTSIEGAQIGDKVRVKVAPYSGARGVVKSAMESNLVLGLESGEEAHVSPEDVTNYSLAARRAWQSMPTRSVGRPKLSGPPKKTVSLRIDAEMWQLLGEVADRGLIPSREQAINTWLRQHLDELLTSRIDAEGTLGDTARS